jgi:hypothetical protein
MPSSNSCTSAVNVRGPRCPLTPGGRQINAQPRLGSVHWTAHGSTRTSPCPYARILLSTSRGWCASGVAPNGASCSDPRERARRTHRRDRQAQTRTIVRKQRRGRGRSARSCPPSPVVVRHTINATIGAGSRAITRTSQLPTRRWSRLLTTTVQGPYSCRLTAVRAWAQCSTKTTVRTTTQSRRLQPASTSYTLDKSSASVYHRHSASTRSSEAITIQRRR